MSSKTLFDISVRAVQCSTCGAPVQCALSGGSVRCEYCGSVNVVLKRRVDVSGAPGGAADPAAEVGRLARLKAQVAHPVHGHLYDLERVPTGLHHARGNPLMLAQEWNRLVVSVRGGQPVDPHRLCWVAVNTSSALVVTGEQLKARALLETAVDLLEDPNHRHIVRCRLAYEAAQLSETRAAAGWLAECDPASEVLELDGEYRTAAARLALAENNPALVLQLIGSSRDDVPTDPPHRSTYAMLRVAALERSGNVAQALLSLRGAHSVSNVSKLLQASGLAPQTMLAYEEQLLQTKQQQLESARKAKKQLRGCLLIAGALVVLGIVGKVLYARFEPFPLVCPHGGELDIDGRSVTQKGTLIQAPHSCTITITDSTLRGDVVIEGGYQTTVIIENSTLRGKRRVMKLTSDAKVEIKDSKLTNKSSGALLDTGNSATIRIDGGELRSKGAIAYTGYRTNLEIEGTKLQSGSGPWAFVLEYDNELLLDDVTLKGAGGLATSKHGAKLRLDGLKFRGGKEASALISTQFRSEVRLKKSELTGPRAGILTVWGSTVELDSSKLTTREAGIVTGYNSTVRLDGSHVKSGATGVKIDWKSQVSLLSKSSIDAGGHGIQGQYDNQLTLDNSSITSKAVAIVVDRSLSLSSKGGRIAGSTASIKSGRGHAVQLSGTKIDGPQQLED